MFRAITIQEFQKFFASEDDCKQYLFDMKWKDGYQCRQCSASRSVKGRTAFHLRCGQCGYDESVTAHTMFHKIKIPLLKAFGMAFRIVVRKKEMSTIELANELAVNQKSSWLFKRKAQEAMKSSGKHLLDNKVEVDELMIGGLDTGERGIVPAFDKQEDIYKGMIVELKAANSQFINSGSLKGDILNNNNVSQWKKFANSLRMMMALITGRIFTLPMTRLFN